MLADLITGWRRLLRRPLLRPSRLLRALLPLLLLLLLVMTGRHRQHRPPVERLAALPNLTRLLSQHEMTQNQDMLSNPIQTPFEYDFHHNVRHKCEEEDTKILFVVPSAPHSFQRRDIFRYSSVFEFARSSKGSVRSSVVFFLGRPAFIGNGKETYEVQKLVDTEAEEYRDIVQSDFVDIYRNMTIKAQLMLRWASTYCHTAQYVIRVDDDCSIRPQLVVEAVIRAGENHDNFILGVIRIDIAPDREGKCSISHKEYAKKKWPPFLLGGLLGYPIITTRLLFEATLRVDWLWLDDVWVTGFCAPKVGAVLLSDKNFVNKHQKEIFKQ